MKISTVTVIGANGTMGRNVSGIFASFGNCKVYLVCRSIEKARKAVEQASMSVKADAIKHNLIACDYSDIQTCLSKSDLIFDSIIEDMKAKEELNVLIDKYANEDTVICTGTSGLSISRLSRPLSDIHKTHYLGMHMFNPPYSLNLCELIPTNLTDRTLVNEVKSYAENVLKRTVIEVKDEPAFLGNRIGFMFINEAMRYAERYKDNGGIDYIDAILGQYTGRTMPPLLTADFVGLDVHKAIVDNVFENTDDYAHDAFILPDYVRRLVKQGNLGRKTKKGLYRSTKTEKGDIDNEVFDILEGDYRNKERYAFSFKNKMIAHLRVGEYNKAIMTLVNNSSMEAEICMEFLLKYILYSVFSANVLTDKISAADDAMANGYNWIPPICLIDAFGGKEKAAELIKDRLGEKVWNYVDGERLFYSIPASKYDYRKFFRAQE